MPSFLSRVLPVCLACLLPDPGLAQEAVRFGAWRAFCAPVAGCVLGVKSEGGDTLAFVEPPNGDVRLLLFLRDPVEPGADLSISFDGGAPLVLDAVAGWRIVESGVGPAVRIAPDAMRVQLAGRMLRRDLMTVVYPARDGVVRRTAFPLDGYADTRGYTDDG